MTTDVISELNNINLNVETTVEYSIKSFVKYKHNRPDIVVWDKRANVCTVIKVSSFEDINIILKIKEKEGKFNCFGTSNFYIQIMKLYSYQ